MYSDFKSLLVLPVLSAVAILMLLVTTPVTIAAGVAAAAVVLGMTYRDANLRGVRVVTQLPPAARKWLGMALVLLGITLVSIIYQNADDQGLKWAMMTAVAHALIVSVLLVPCLAQPDAGPFRWLVSTASMVAAMYLLNLVADAAGFGFESLRAREQFWGSRYIEGGYRWQSPLISSWQLSGLGRWAVAVLVAGILFVHRRRWPMYLLVGWVLVIAYGSVKLEYRAAVFPLLAMLGWLAVVRRDLRGWLAASAIAYTAAAPFLFGTDYFTEILRESIPTSVTRLLGDSDENVLSLSGRTDIWAMALDRLGEGDYLVFGQGFVNLDASWTEALDLSFMDFEITKYSFHQGFLDLLYMTGTLPGTLIFFSGLFYVVRFGPFSRESGVKPSLLVSDDRSLSLLALAMVAVANSHDGFLNSHLVFPSIMVMCAAGLAMRPASVGAAARPKIARAPAVPALQDSLRSP